VNQPPLRTCPLCGSAYDAEKLGLRDYSWLTDTIPGASDVDFVVEQQSTGRLLAAEFKSEGERLPKGQRLLLKTLVRKGCDVWVCWQLHNGRIQRYVMNGTGNFGSMVVLTRQQFSKQVHAWWAEGLAQEAA